MSPSYFSDFPKLSYFSKIYALSLFATCEATQTHYTRCQVLFLSNKPNIYQNTLDCQILLPKMVYFTLIIFKSFIRIQISENSPVSAYNNKICQKIQYNMPQTCKMVLTENC